VTGKYLKKYRGVLEQYEQTLKNACRFRRNAEKDFAGAIE